MRPSVHLLLSIPLVAFSVASPARADGESSAIVAAPTTSGAAAAPSTRRLETTSRWYGWQNLLVDGGGVALMFGGAVSSGTRLTDAMLVVGVSTYVIGSGVVHFAHSRYAAGGAAVALHVGLPLLGAVIGAKAENCSLASHPNDGDGFCGVFGGLLGLLTGIVAATTIDAATLAYEDVPVAPTTSLRVTPAVSFSGGRATLGLAATF